MKKISVFCIIFLMLVGHIAAKKHVKSKLASRFKLTSSMRLRVDSLLKIVTPVMGYRFVVVGNFNGDRKIDTLYERYTNHTYQKEEPKYYDSPDSNFAYDDIVFLCEYLQNKSFLAWKNSNIKLAGGQLGFQYVENCGDINQDGKDELLVVKQWADWSNCNTAYIYTFDKKAWRKIYEFHVWEWQFPATPSATMLPGFFGNFEYAVLKNDSIDKALEKQLQEFKFIKYYSDNSVEFSGTNPIPLWKAPKLEAEFEILGQDNFLKKYYDTVRIDGSLYFRDKKNRSILYKNTKEDAEESNGGELTTGTEVNEEENTLDLDDAAAMITTRIYINHAKSPFKK